MPPLFGQWADLPPELLCRIGDSLALKCYASARGCCTAWRCALAPPSPSLLLVPDDTSCFPSVASIPTRRAFQLKAIPTGAQCVGSSGGWLAIFVPISDGQSSTLISVATTTAATTAARISLPTFIYVSSSSTWVSKHVSSALSLFNPVTAAEIALPPLIHGSGMPISKIVLAPNPALDDFAATAICDTDRLVYVTAGARRWAVLDPIPLADGDRLTDAVYHEKEGTVYCLTGYGDVHVLHLPQRRRREPFMDEEPSSLPGKPPITDDQPSSLPGKPMTICRRGLSAAEIDRRRPAQQRHAMIHSRSSGPHLNAPAKVEPLLPLPFNPATGLAPPYNKLSLFTSVKKLVFCEGNLYQIWRNASCTVTLQLPAGGGRRRLEENEVFVLRYYPDRQPCCWDAVTDLGGYSVFVGRNNAVSMYAQGVPGLKGNCVYWIGGRGRDQGMVFDMATRRSTPCLLPTAAAAGVARQTTVCWYFLQ